MSAAVPSADSPPPAAAPATPRRSRWQFSLRMILLAMAAVGVWTAEIVNRRAIPQLERRIAAMRPLAHELDIRDPNKPAIVKRDELWYDENEWDVYLPDDRYHLSIATQQVNSQAMSPPAKTAALPAGQCRLVLTQEKTDSGWRVRVTKNARDLLIVDEPAAWYPASGSSGGGQYSTAAQPDPAQPIVLFRRRFSRPIVGSSSQVPSGPCEGILLWIERTGDAAD